MMNAFRLAWLQLRRERSRFAAALAGVSFAVILICMQLGFQRALFESSVRYHDTFAYDIAMISPETSFIVQPVSFSRRRVVRARAHPEVVDASSVQLGQAVWKDPTNPANARTIYVVGFDPADRVFAVPQINDQRTRLRLRDTALFDRHSRSEFGPVAELLATQGRVSTDVAGRRIDVVGLFPLGTSFGIDGSLVVSELNFRRLFPHRTGAHTELGLIRLRDGADPDRVRDELAATLAPDVELLTRADFISREIGYWNRSTPIGYVFNFGVMIGLVVGAIIVYQILFADVSDHLQEYATLKAIGYTDSFLFTLVLAEAGILATLGFLPGLALSCGLYRAAGEATRLPLQMTGGIAMGVFALTTAMCAVSGGIALRKLRSADPADIF